MKQSNIKLFTRYLSLVLAFILILGTVACDIETNPKESSTTPNSTTNSSTPSGNNANGGKETSSSTAGTPTNSAIPESTAKPTATANNNTPSATPTQEKPTANPTTVAPTATPYVPAVTADPAVYPDDFGKKRGPIRTDGTIIFWSESRAMYTIPEGFPKLETWSAVELSDVENEQMVIRVGDTMEIVQYYAIVKGKFYKLTEGNITMMSMDSLNQTYKWIEDNGLVKSLNLRSKNYNEVFIEAENIVSWANATKDMYETTEGKIVSGNNKNVLANVICYN